MSIPVRISLAYLVFGMSWVLVSDQFASHCLQTSQAATLFQSVKGSSFVLLSSLLLFGLARSQLRRVEAIEEENRRLLRRTLEKVHHVLRNYLNQMQLVSLEAEGCPHFSPSVLELTETASREVVSALERLEEPEGAAGDRPGAAGAVERDRSVCTGIPPG